MPKLTVSKEELVMLRKAAGIPVDQFTDRIAELKLLLNSLDDVNVQP